MDRNAKLYQDFFKLYMKVHTEKTGKAAQAGANEVWKKVIKEGKNKINEDIFKSEVSKLNEQLKKRPSNSIVNFFKKPKTSQSKEKNDESDSEAIVPIQIENNSPPEQSKVQEDINPEVSIDDLNIKRTYDKPGQEKLKAELAKTEKVLLGLIESRNLGLAGPSGETSFAKQIKEVTNHKEDLERDLKRLECLAKAQQKFREKRKNEVSQLKEDFPQICSSLTAGNRDKVGRPRIECDQPGLLQDILQIAVIGAAPCGDKRRDDIFRTVKTLDDLHDEITKRNYQISRSALHFRLLPRDRTTVNGKRHVVTVPVKLIRPQNNLRKGHPDRMFAAESCKAVDDIVAYLGPDCAVFLSQDDKSSVPLGVVAAKKQSSILMSLQCRVRLPDHDFKVGSKHLLTPSVIAVCVISSKGGVTYSGPTYVAVRSAKHNGSTAFSHYEDLLRLIELEPEIFHIPGSTTELKPVIVKGVDGGPDENPRYHNNINMSCKTFFQLGCDCYIEVTNAPGLSAYNRAERRMHPLSQALTGVVLPYETFGSHLDGQGKTVDVDLEKKNFDAAGEILAEIFEETVIDGFPVHSEYIKTPVNAGIKEYTPTPLFRSRHVLETQYLTVVLKCDDRSCCSKPKTSINMFFPNRAIPPLIPIRLTPSGPEALERSKNIYKSEVKFPNVFARIVAQDHLLSEDIKKEFNDNVPYDLFFPTVEEKIKKRICKNCFKYHASVKSLTLHKKVCKKKKSTRKESMFSSVYTDDEDEEIEVEESDDNNNTDVDISDEDDGSSDDELTDAPGRAISVSFSGTFDKILDLKQWMMSPWGPDNVDK